MRGEEGEGNFAGAVGERQRVAGEDLQLVNQVVRQARLLKRKTLASNFYLKVITMNRALTDSRSLSPMEAVAVLHMSYIVLSSDSEVTTGCSCCYTSENGDN